MIDYGKRLVEVDEILNYLSTEDYNKIPIKYIEVIKQNKDINYIWKYNKNRKLKDQDVSDDTIAILSYLNTEFLLNNKQKDFVYRLHELNNINHNENNKTNDAFYNKDIFDKKINDEVENNKDIIIVHNENKFIKFIRKIMNLFQYKK